MLSILNYMVTSNHIHLMVSDNGDRDTIPKSIQLIAGRTGQEYNQRKNRKGAFWEDRYHATAIALDEHLFKCMVYIDMNMVRAGVVKHPAEWPFCGYNEIQNPRQRYSLIDYHKLIPLLQMKDPSGRYIRWADLRLIRRMLRDAAYRAYDPRRTLLHWHYVRSSEMRNIIPYINTADYIINTAMPYELSIYRPKLFDQFAAWVKEYSDDSLHLDAFERADRIAKILRVISPILDDSLVPSDSVLREFIGGSIYEY